MVSEFLIPALQKTKVYKRVSGYFSSAVFAEAAEGIGALVANGGVMQLVTSHALTPKDANQLDKFLADGDFAAELIRQFEKDLNTVASTEDLLARDHLKAMCWMLAQGFLEVKVVVPKATNEKVRLGDYEKFHPKFGIFQDANGESITFSGSLNETFSGWFRNVENICVYKSWQQGLEDYVNAYSEQFDAYWGNNAGSDWEVISLPDAVKNKMIELTGADEFPERFKNRDVGNSRGLRKYQNDAVEKWIENGYRGILEMATGTGKTRTAKACIAEVAGITKKLLVVAVAPYEHIAGQWIEELKEYSPVMVSGSNKWRTGGKDLILQLQLNHLDVAVFIAVKNTAASEDFRRMVSEVSSLVDKTLFIGDEVHWLGAPSLQSALLPFADYRLGLSATPNRYFDEEGTDVLIDYFKGVIYKFGLREALNWVDVETGQTVLCNYSYHPIFVELNDEELLDYNAKSKALARAMSGEKTPENLKMIELYRLLRAEIGKSAAAKIPALENLLGTLPGEISYTIIYCSDSTQMESIATELRKRKMDFQKVTGETSTSKSREFNGSSERETVLRNFERGQIDVLLAIDCLDEGVDIPAAKQAIILASSGNPKEFIQRRGRIMRQFPGKEKATIYDFVVIAPEADARKDEDLLRVYQVELDRVADFAEDSMNKQEVIDLLVAKGYKLKEQVIAND